MNSSLQIIPAYIENKASYIISKKGIILCVFVYDKRTSRKELHLNIKKLAIVVYIAEKLWKELYIYIFHKIWRYFMFKSQFFFLYFDVSSRISNWWKSCGQGRPILGEKSNVEQISLFSSENVHLNFTHRITPLHVTNGFSDICVWTTQCCMKQVNFLWKITSQ